MHYDTLPSEFSELAGKVQYVRRVNAHEWSSSCPQCGGSQHPGGEPPDRFRMWTRNRNGNVFGWCRRCSYFWSPNQSKKMSPEEFEKWRAEQLRIEQERKAAAEKAIALLQSEHLWDLYHQGLTEYSKSIIQNWGISAKWASYWKLGFNPDLLIYNKTHGEYHNPAISIPLWQLDGRVANIKFRALNPVEPNDRYRMAYKTGLTFLFWSFREVNLKECLVVEGEKKAMVSALHLYENGLKMQVIGLPSVTPSAELLQELDGFTKITLCLDPDSRIKQNGLSPEARAVDILGRERTKVLRLPHKVDDMIVQNKLQLKDALKYAN